jgi:hypothetical protein
MSVQAVTKNVAIDDPGQLQSGGTHKLPALEPFSGIRLDSTNKHNRSGARYFSKPPHYSYALQPDRNRQPPEELVGTGYAAYSASGRFFHLTAAYRFLNLIMEIRT